MAEVEADLSGDVGIQRQFLEAIPGAMASTVNSTRLMPINVGMVMRKRRSKYLCTSSPKPYVSRYQ